MALFALVEPPDCRFAMRRNEIAPGTRVSVEPRRGARITFAKVLTGGTVGVIPLTTTGREARR